MGRLSLFLLEIALLTNGRYTGNRGDKPELADTTDARREEERFALRVDELRRALLDSDPFLLAEHTGSQFEPIDENRGVFYLKLWGSQVALAFPEFTAHYMPSGDSLPLFHLALLLYYFSSADGTPVSGSWISFSELPDGRFYARAFQGYTGDELGRLFCNDTASFTQAAKSIGGFLHSLGTASFSFQALPRIPILVVFWQGDEDFPPSYKILFDSAAGHYLPTDAYAILGSSLTRRLAASKADHE